MTTTNQTAFEAGLKDGTAAVHESEEDLTAEQVEEWFASGKLDPDEALINALDEAGRARVLGLTRDEETDRGDAWDAALAAYNEGYRTGARRAVGS